MTGPPADPEMYGPPISAGKNFGTCQQKVNALRESFRRSFFVPGRLAGDALITIRQEGVVDREKFSISALVA